MDIFPALGLAVLGIFVTIILSGVLAGIIAFGLIDTGQRKATQQRILERLVEAPVRAALEDDEANDFVPRNVSDHHGWAWHTMDLLTKGKPTLFVEILRLDPDLLYRLPYRQLCGKIANAIGGEAFDGPHAHEPRFQPATMMLLIAENATRPISQHLYADISYGIAKVRALAFVDSIQISLADAVQHRAQSISFCVIAVILLSLLVPSLHALNIFATEHSLFLRSVGGVSAIVCAAALLFMLSLAATIVATLTFSWIDRFASAR